MNSIHAISDRGNDDGHIRITVIREQAVVPTDAHGNYIAPIVSFEIEDNGIGFTDDNYKSFETVDGRRKAARGGKGVGRLLWLKAFDAVEVASTYPEHRAWWKRSFKFTLTDRGIEDHVIDKVKPKEARGSPRTVVRLLGFKDRYRAACPKLLDAIARRTIEHVMEYFLLKTAPQIVISEAHDDREIDLHQLVEQQLSPQVEEQKLTVKGEVFDLRHVLIRAPADTPHRMHYCAHERVVEEDNLQKLIPHLETTLPGADGEGRIHAGYVTGRLLDERVDEERTGFTIDSRGEIPFEGGPAREDITEAAIEAAKEYLAPRTAEVREKVVQRVQQMVETNQPRYRPVLKHRLAQVAELSSNLSDELTHEFGDPLWERRGCPFPCRSVCVPAHLDFRYVA